MHQLDDLLSLTDSHTRSDRRRSSARRRLGPSYELSSEQKADLKLAFDTFDINGTGWIGVEELRVAIRALGYEPKMVDLQAMLTQVDKEGKGKISFDDFLHLIAAKMSQKDTTEEIMKSFRLIDRSGSGQIKFGDLKRVAEELEETLNDEEIEEMIKEADTNDDEIVTLDDFLKIHRKFRGLRVQANSRDF